MWRERFVPRDGWRYIRQGSSMEISSPQSSPLMKVGSLMAIVKWRGESIKKKMIFNPPPTKWITLYLLDIKYENRNWKKD
jgi:hypothetical protein